MVSKEEYRALDRFLGQVLERDPIGAAITSYQLPAHRRALLWDPIADAQFPAAVDMRWIYAALRACDVGDEIGMHRAYREASHETKPIVARVLRELRS